MVSVHVLEISRKAVFYSAVDLKFPNRRKLQTLEMIHHNQAEICGRDPSMPKSRRLPNIIVLEDAKFEENH